MLNIKHKFCILQTALAVYLSVQKPFIATVFQNDDNSSIWWQSCKSDWRSYTRLLDYTMFYSYV